ncbi:MAG: SEC59/DGK1/VTE5 family protein [Candidatus Cloacimonetes bacterium]|nr:SEC59/DGK1/VTE5 family protein [Candidatus Cloacimonadota bacterium]
MPDRKITEVLRKSIHLSSIILPFTYRYIIKDKVTMFLILLGLNILILLVEFFRMEHRTIKRLFYRFFGTMLRRHEIKNEFTGACYLITSATICVAFFPKDIAFLSLAMLSIGDTFAAIFGILFGKRKITAHKKSLEGSLACFISTFTFALFFTKPQIALAGAIATTVIETLNIPLDDNIRIPLFAGIVMSIVWVFII